VVKSFCTSRNAFPFTICEFANLPSRIAFANVLADSSVCSKNTSSINSDIVRSFIDFLLKWLRIAAPMRQFPPPALPPATSLNPSSKKIGNRCRFFSKLPVGRAEVSEGRGSKGAIGRREQSKKSIFTHDPRARLRDPRCLAGRAQWNFHVVNFCIRQQVLPLSRSCRSQGRQIDPTQGPIFHSVRSANAYPCGPLQPNHQRKKHPR
jgi:hypothetical protein